MGTRIEKIDRFLSDRQYKLLANPAKWVDHVDNEVAKDRAANYEFRNTKTVQGAKTINEPGKPYSRPRLNERQRAQELAALHPVGSLSMKESNKRPRTPKEEIEEEEEIIEDEEEAPEEDEREPQEQSPKRPTSTKSARAVAGNNRLGQSSNARKRQLLRRLEKACAILQLDFDYDMTFPIETLADDLDFFEESVHQERHTNLYKKAIRIGGKCVEIISKNLTNDKLQLEGLGQHLYESDDIGDLIEEYCTETTEFDTKTGRPKRMDTKVLLALTAGQTTVDFYGGKSTNPFAKVLCNNDLFGLKKNRDSIRGMRTQRKNFYRVREPKSAPENERFSVEEVIESSQPQYVPAQVPQYIPQPQQGQVSQPQQYIDDINNFGSPFQMNSVLPDVQANPKDTMSFSDILSSPTGFASPSNLHRSPTAPLGYVDPANNEQQYLQIIQSLRNEKDELERKVLESTSAVNVASLHKNVSKAKSKKKGKESDDEDDILILSPVEKTEKDDDNDTDDESGPETDSEPKKSKKVTVSKDGKGKKDSKKKKKEKKVVVQEREIESKNKKGAKDKKDKKKKKVSKPDADDSDIATDVETETESDAEEPVSPTPKSNKKTFEKKESVKKSVQVDKLLVTKDEPVPIPTPKKDDADISDQPDTSVLEPTEDSESALVKKDKISKKKKNKSEQNEHDEPEESDSEKKPSIKLSITPSTSKEARKKKVLSFLTSPSNKTKPKARMTIAK